MPEYDPTAKGGHGRLEAKQVTGAYFDPNHPVHAATSSAVDMPPGHVWPAQVSSSKRRYAGRLKTKLCSQFAQGECALGAGCAFAHGEDDLRAGPCPAPPPPPQPPLLLQQLRGQTAFDGLLLPSTGQLPSMAPPLVPRYRCPDCGQEFTAWSLCRQHVLEAGHADASNTKGLQQRCMAPPPMAPPPMAAPPMAPPPMALGCTGCAAGAPMSSAPGHPTHVPSLEGVDVSLDEEQQLVRYTPLPCPYLAAHPYLAVLRPFALLHPAVPSHPAAPPCPAAPSHPGN